jgi:HD-GYP domain-containing protein (c-di-GMP phosphodiesterase class II)
MRIPRKERQKLEYAAFLQDIGNVRVPHAILNKTRKLTAHEFGIVKKHTLIGTEMVEQLKFLKDISPIIRHHHEHWDGTGYPDGLAGDQIPVCARILSVCTAYDSMIHARAYRGGMDDESAVKEIRAGAGAKYDPAAVEALLRVLKRLQRDD